MGIAPSLNKSNKGCSNGSHGTNDETFRYVNGRRYLRDFNKYLLPNDYQELDRLQLEHYIHLQIWKSYFSSPIDTILKLGGIEVLDVGCGSGVWLLEMAANYPLSHFTGIDVAPLYPEDTHPLNATFESVDASQVLPYPDETFDFIHIKCVISTMPEKSVKSLFGELKRVLKPGGWLEIMDYASEFYNTGPSYKVFLGSFQALWRQHGIGLYTINDIPKMFAKHEFLDIRIEEKLIDLGENGGNLGDLSLKSITTIWSTLRNSLSEFTSMDAASFSNLIQVFKEEVNEYQTGCKLYRIYAQKPQTKFFL